MEEFNTQREFNNNFPSKIFICPKCGKITTNPYYCSKCGEQANKLFNTEGLFEYRIQNENPQTIFKPIEMDMTNDT